MGCSPFQLLINPTEMLFDRSVVTDVNDSSYWTPSLKGVFQIQLTDYPPDIHMNADVFELDIFETTPAAIKFLHQHGKKVICYFNAGAWEEFRPDAEKFPLDVIGNPYFGWPGEKWLDISRYDAFSQILLERLDLAVRKGCDGVDPDNVDGCLQPTGFNITLQDQLEYNTWLSEQAHQRGLAIGLNNNGEQALELVDHFDFAVIEDCAVYNECDSYQIFIEKQKVVFQIEYTDRIANTRKVCTKSKPLGFQLLLKNRDLDAFVEYCP